MTTPLPLGLVVAVARNGVIGHRGTLPWHLPEDLKHFKAVTLGHAIIMGRRTHESIGRALPGRRNIVVTREPTAKFEGCEVASSLEAALALARQTDPMPMVIGGAQLYQAALPLVTSVWLTEVNRDVEGDTRLPFNRSDWHEVSRRAGADDVTFFELVRKAPK